MHGRGPGWRRLRGAGFGLLLVAACTPYSTGSLGPASLPPDAVVGAGDPLRSAVIASSSAFISPARLSPADAARSIAQMEFLAINLPQSPTLRTSPGTLGPQLNLARQEWRSVLGISPAAPAQSVINGLYGAARALDGGQMDVALAALSRVPFQRGGPATLALLSALPPLPRTAEAAATARQTLQDPGSSSRMRI